jgi:5-methylcytosine-specific restriction endonuclease McrA
MPRILEKGIKNRVTNLKSRSKRLGCEFPKRDEMFYLVRSSFKNGFVCYYCGISLKIKGDGYNKFSIDHKIPISRGGGNDIDNMCVCCVRCNEVKGCMTEHEFRDMCNGYEGDELIQFLEIMHRKIRKCEYV